MFQTSQPSNLFGKDMVQLRIKFMQSDVISYDLRNNVRERHVRPNVPYHHPPLSKDYLSGEKTAQELLIRPEEAYASANVTLNLGTRVMKIDRAAKTVTTDNDETIAYDKLVLAIGARVRKLPIDGADLPNVFYLRDMADVTAIKSAMTSAKRAVIIGGGYIGLETAASLKSSALM